MPPKKGCIVRNCISASGKFCLPRNEAIRMIWLEKLKRLDLANLCRSTLQNYKICHLHFSDRCYANALRERLNRNAVPNEVFDTEVLEIETELTEEELTLAQKRMLASYMEVFQSPAIVSKKFQEQFKRNPPEYSTISRIYEKFVRTGSVADDK